MKILSFDIEEWYIEKMFRGGEQWKYDAYDSMLERVLELLDRHDVKATFFCLGALAEHFPGVVRRIAAAGHEIGCHSLAHKWVNKQTPAEFLSETRDAVSALQDCSGLPVTSYRAPAFSIGEKNIWAFDVLAECGIKNDASVFPGTRDFGGFPAFAGNERPCRINTGINEINEFPVTMGRIPFVGRPIAYSGGGYFRLLPLSFVKRQMDRTDYVMCYFHMADLVDFKSRMMSRDEFERYFKVRGSMKNRILRYVKSNLGRKRAFAGLSGLLDIYKFVSVEEAAAGLSEFPEIKLNGVV